MAVGKHIFRGTIEVPVAKTNKEAVNLGQVKDLVNRYNKEPVKVATTGELTGSYLDNVLTLNTDINELDGVVLEVGDSILVKDQTDKSQNAVYVVTELGTKGTPSSATATTTSTSITSVSVDKNTFESKVNPTIDKSYVYTYSTTDTNWKDEGSNVVTLSDYGITFVGTESDSDTITIAYKKSTVGTNGKLTRREDFEEKKIVLNNTFVNVMTGESNKDTRWTIVSDGVLTCGTSSFTFIKDIDVSESTIKVAKASIVPDGIEKVFNVAHNFNLKDSYGYILKIMDGQHNIVAVDNVPKTGDESNAITITFDEVPDSTESFTVYILGLE